MLEEIRIKNLGVIDEAVLPLGPGFTALTGETGAGKTMVVTALGLLLGERADSGAIRSNTETASVDGVWVLSESSPAIQLAAELDATLESVGEQNREIIVSRSLSQQGRSRAIIGGRPAPIAKLTELSEYLITVHGQSDQLRLKSASQQRDTLDLYTGGEHRTLLADYSSNFRLWQQDLMKLQTLKQQGEERATEADQLREALNDFEKVQPMPHEDEELRAQAEKLENSEELRALVSASYNILKSETESEYDVLTRFNTAKRSLERAQSLDHSLAPQLEAFIGLEISLSEQASELAHYLSEIDGDSVLELERVQARRAELNQLARKYGGDLEAAIHYAEGASDRLLELDQTGDQIETLENEIAKLQEILGQQSTQISKQRNLAAAELGDEITAELRALAMPDAEVRILVEPLAELNSTGADQVQFLLSPHPGAEPRPIAKGASGGELSRVMLAIEVVLSTVDPVPTLIFDEIDAGVGGAAAREIGRRLAKLAEHSQVIVVTHLAQVAAFADHHVNVVKSSADGSTVSAVFALEGEARVAEIARLLSGHPDSENALAHARELLESRIIG